VFCVLRWLALIVIMAICTQMAVCMAEDYHGEPDGSTTPAGSNSDCSCHDCACCSLHVGFPPRVAAVVATIIELIPTAPVPHLTEKARPRLDHPPRP
jgi:hypothetical protein